LIHLSGKYLKLRLTKCCKIVIKNNAGYSVPNPKITVNKTIDINKNKVDPSYLPYLHRNPAV
ncbi:MAG: hypothetical protein ACK56F_21080, partial [bacterium]